MDTYVVNVKVMVKAASDKDASDRALQVLNKPLNEWMADETRPPFRAGACLYWQVDADPKKF